jgi:hypothetical protein
MNTTENFSTAAPAESVSSAIQLLEAQIAELEAKKEVALKAEEEKKNAKIVEMYAKIDSLKNGLGISTDQELITLLRNRNLSSPKAKRLPETTLKQMKLALQKGATAPEVAKWFHVSLATVHSRKAQWKLTHRPNVKPLPIKEALKGA